MWKGVVAFFRKNWQTKRLRREVTSEFTRIGESLKQVKSIKRVKYESFSTLFVSSLKKRKNNSSDLSQKQREKSVFQQFRFCEIRAILRWEDSRSIIGMTSFSRSQNTWWKNGNMHSYSTDIISYLRWCMYTGVKSSPQHITHSPYDEHASFPPPEKHLLSGHSHTFHSFFRSKVRMGGLVTKRVYPPETLVHDWLISFWWDASRRDVSPQFLVARWRRKMQI